MASMGTRGGDGDKVAGMGMGTGNGYGDGVGMGTWLWIWGGDREKLWGWGQYILSCHSLLTKCGTDCHMAILTFVHYALLVYIVK